MKRFLTALLFTAALARPALAGDDAVAYRLTPEMGDAGLVSLAVEMRFRGDEDGSTELRLPSEFAGADGLLAQFSEIAAEGATLSGDGASRTLSHAPGQAIVVRYRVRQTHEGELVFGGVNPFGAMVQPAWFTVIGGTIFAEVGGRREEPASFAWGPRPAGWTLASDLDHAPAAGQPRRTADLLDAVLVGGAGLELIERPVAEGRVRLAFHADWEFDEDRIADMLQRIAETSADFWGDDRDEFLVTVTRMQAPPGQKVHAGLNLGDAFSLWLSPAADEEELARLLAHEHQHSWLPNRVGTTDEGLSDDPVGYWLAEGFTDFYTQRMLLRSGLWTLEDYVADLNAALLKYAGSPVREASNEAIRKDFWNDRAMAELPYQRGMLLAAVWDHRLRRATSGVRDLDDVVLAMRAAFRADLGQADRPAAAERLKRAYAAAGGGSLDADYAAHVEAGRAVLLPADLFGACARVETVQIPAFDRGYASARGGVIGGVDPEGKAFAAGLRDGMRILRREGGITGDSRVEQVLAVDDGGTERIIRWRPEGKAAITLQTVVLAPGMTAEARAACVRSMAGL